MECMRVNEKAVKGFVNNEVFNLVRLNTFLHAQALTSTLALSGFAVVLDTDFEFQVLHP